MKVVWLVVVAVAITSTLARAEDMAEMISRYRREHGLSTVRTDPQLTAMAERQAKAMAASGIMDHDIAGSFSSRISGERMGMASENIAAGTKTWAETFRMWQASPGHNANLLNRGPTASELPSPQRPDPLQNVLGDGDRGKAAEKQRAQGCRGRGAARER